MGWFFGFGRNSLSGLTGNDSYVRTPVPWLQRFMNSSVKEQYLTENMNEYEIYATTPEVYIVFNRFASMFSNGEFKHYRKLKDGTIQEIEKSDIVKLLKKPNPTQSGKEWLIECVLHYLIYGNRVSYPFFPTKISTVPRVINNLPPEHIKITTTGKRWEQTTIDGIIKNYKLENYGNEEDKRVFLPSELIHHRNIDPDNPVTGKSCLQSLHMPISNIRGAYGFRNVNITKRGGLGFVTNYSSDALGSNLPISSADRKKIEEQYAKDTHGIHDGQSSISMVSGDLKFVHTAYPIDQMMLFEEVSADMQKIIDAVNLNDNIFSREKGSTYANLIEGLKMGYQDGVIPFSLDFCEGLSRGLRLPEDEYLCLDYSGVPALKEDLVKSSQIAERTSRAYWNLIDAGMDEKEAYEIIYGTK